MFHVKQGLEARHTYYASRLRDRPRCPRCSCPEQTRDRSETGAHRTPSADRHRRVIQYQGRSGAAAECTPIWFHVKQRPNRVRRSHPASEGIPSTGRPGGGCHCRREKTVVQSRMSHTSALRCAVDGSRDCTDRSALQGILRARARGGFRAAAARERPRGRRTTRRPTACADAAAKSNEGHSVPPLPHVFPRSLVCVSRETRAFSNVVLPDVGERAVSLLLLLPLGGWRQIPRHGS